MYYYYNSHTQQHLLVLRVPEYDCSSEALLDSLLLLLKSTHPGIICRSVYPVNYWGILLHPIFNIVARHEGNILKKKKKAAQKFGLFLYFGSFFSFFVSEERITAAALLFLRPLQLLQCLLTSSSIRYQLWQAVQLFF